VYYQADAGDMFTDRKKLDRFLRALSALVNEAIPHQEQVQKVNISLSYPWSKD
jgi:hypothetical protein